MKAYSLSNLGTLILENVQALPGPTKGISLLPWRDQQPVR